MIATSSVPLLLAGLLADDPGRPRLTWYGPGGDRVEFSAKVLGNWVAKTANLLAADLGAEPGTTVRLVLPTHWRTVVWMLATWSVGAHVVLVDDEGAGGPADVVVSDSAAVLAAAGGAEAVGVALPSLATTFGVTLPPGAVDSGVEVRLQPDAFVPLVAPSPDDPALTLPDGHVLTHGGLLDAARVASVNLPALPRVLTDAPPADVVTIWLAALTASGSLVLHHDLTALTPEALTSLQTQEQITSTTHR